MNLDELLEWHLHNAEECDHEDEEEQRVFHLEAVAVLTKIKLNKEGK